MIKIATKCFGNKGHLFMKGREYWLPGGTSFPIFGVVFMFRLFFIF